MVTMLAGGSVRREKKKKIFSAVSLSRNPESNIIDLRGPLNPRERKKRRAIDMRRSFRVGSLVFKAPRGRERERSRWCQFSALMIVIYEFCGLGKNRWTFGIFFSRGIYRSIEGIYIAALENITDGGQLEMERAEWII